MFHCVCVHFMSVRVSACWNTFTGNNYNKINNNNNTYIICWHLLMYRNFKQEHCRSSHCCIRVLIIPCAAFRNNVFPWNCVTPSWSLGCMFVHFCFRRLVRVLVLSHLSVALHRWIRLARACTRGNWFWSTTNWRTENVTILRRLENCHRVLIWT